LWCFSSIIGCPGIRASDDVKREGTPGKLLDTPNPVSEGRKERLWQLAIQVKEARNSTRSTLQHEHQTNFSTQTKRCHQHHRPPNNPLPPTEITPGRAVSDLRSNGDRPPAAVDVASGTLRHAPRDFPGSAPPSSLRFPRPPSNMASVTVYIAVVASLCRTARTTPGQCSKGKPHILQT
jgi:hypothetical protein